MTDTNSSTNKRRFIRILRSIFAVIAGIVASAVPAMVTDFIIERAIGRLLLSNGELFIAFAYRAVYTVIGAYVTALLSPRRPMKHVIILGSIGMLPWLIGLFMMWNVVPKWFMPVGIVTSIPLAWIGGKLRETQIKSRSSAQFEKT